MLLLALLLAPATQQPRQAAAQSGAVTVDLISIGDARIQGGSPDQGFGNGYIWVGTPNGHLAYVQFDLTALPANATITNAELRLYFTGVYTGTANVEIGRNDGAWDEATVTWNTQPATTWGGPVQSVGDTAGDIVWPVTPLVTQWHNGTLPNYGFALRGDGELKAFHSSETGCIPSDEIECDPPRLPPRLVVTYTAPPPEGARPDLGDAPDSSNNVGVTSNTAYPGVPGNFPTVWNGTPAGQPAGPRHANQTGEGILGQYLSREFEADTGNDEDGANNILAGGANNANNDRGDDGWRNHQASFDHCTQTTLTVRVSKATGATLDRMFLNVWFDGAHDGDWDDRTTCTPDGENLAIPATEWIVQDYYVDMTGIPAGGYVDIAINTETILNTSPDKRHWMRFTLSEARTPQTANGRADGRGPHPSAGSYQFGETEDILQRPPAAGEPGTLELDKRVILNSNPLDQLEAFRYEIRLRHVGGAQPIQAEIRDELPYTLYTDSSVSYSEITGAGIDVSTTGSVSPLQADYEVKPAQYPTPERWLVKWRGALAPDSEIILTVNARMFVLCPEGQQTQQITNVAQARPRGGSPISAEVTFNADCLGYDWEMIQVDLENLEGLLTVENYRDILLRATIRNNHSVPVALGVNPVLNKSGAQTAAISLPSFAKITLEPGESRPVEFKLRLSELVKDELNEADELNFAGTLNYCILPNKNATQCPDSGQYPQLHGQSEPFTIAVRPRDLGDAPDSTNHPGAAMMANAGVPASFPTVFDPSTGLPQGPLHAHPQPFHLGQQVSREAEADVGPDQEPNNNILPTANVPNQDRFDDGINPQAWNLTHCQATTVPVRVFISPPAVNWFQQQEKPAYLNLWLDGNRDGDWDDGGNCRAGQDAVEHIVRDFPVDVVSLGAGLHTLSVPTDLVPWPAQQAENPAWVRITLSENESNKTLQFGSITYGDGRGYDKPFRTGETEDYLAYPQGTIGGGPDMGVQLQSEARSSGANGNDQVRFKLDYSNLGAQPADGTLLTFQKPEQLRNLQLTLLRTPGIPNGNITETSETVQFALPNIAPGEGGSIVLGWDGSLPRAAVAAATQANAYTARARIQLDGDIDTSNNEAETSVAAPERAPVIAAVAADGAAWGLRETTCRSDVDLVGRAEPGVPYDLVLDGNILTSITADANGAFTYQLQNLSDGRHTIRLEAAQFSRTLVIDVDSGLKIDPLSLVFTDSQGRNFHPRTLGWPQDTSSATVNLRAGETYQVGIDSCIGNRNGQIDLTLDDTLTIALIEDNADGRYTASFTYEPPVQSAALAATGELRFDVIDGSTRQSFTAPLNSLTLGTVSDARSGQPLADASVTALEAQEANDGTTLYSAWPAEALGQANPQTTGADGTYSFSALGASSRLEVAHNGYQLYRSGAIDTSAGILNQNVALTPEIAGTPSHTIYVTANGFQPSILRVSRGSLIEWVNVDLDEHNMSSSGWDSGALAAGQIYRLTMNNIGSISYQDAANPLNTATIIVDNGKVFLPLVGR
jgi:plastocyanin